MLRIHGDSSYSPVKDAVKRTWGLTSKDLNFLLFLSIITASLTCIIG